MSGTSKEELYTELKALDEEVKALNSHLERIDEQLSELGSSKRVVNEFSELKKGEELRVLLSSGIYVKAELADTKNLMVNVGANVSVEKTPEEVAKILDSQLVELSGYRESLVGQMKTKIKRIEEIQKEFE